MELRAARVSKRCLIAPKESLPYGRGSLRGARKQATSQSLPKNHPLTVLARCEPRALASDIPIAPKKSLPYGRGSLRAARVSKRCLIAPKESLPYGRGSLRAARVSKRCLIVPKNHSLTVVARCEPRALASDIPIAPKESLPHGRGSLRAARVSKRRPNRSQKITPSRSWLVASRAR